MFALIRHEAHFFFPDALTPEGQAAIPELAKTLSLRGDWRSVLASPKQRTRETAELLAVNLHLPCKVEPGLAERGNHEPWLPPHPNDGAILVTHAPVIREMLRAWCRHFKIEEPGGTPLGGGWIVDIERGIVQAIHE